MKFGGIVSSLTSFCAVFTPILFVSVFLVADGRMGGVKLYLWHRYPQGWYMNDNGQLQTEMNVTLSALIDGFETTIVLPWGEEQRVLVSPGTPMVQIMKGLKVIKEGVGVPNHGGERGDVSVSVQWDYEEREQFDKKALLEVAKSSGYYDEDFLYLYMTMTLNMPEKRAGNGFDPSEDDYSDSIQILEGSVDEENTEKEEGTKPGIGIDDEGESDKQQQKDASSDVNKEEKTGKSFNRQKKWIASDEDEKNKDEKHHYQDKEM